MQPAFIDKSGGEMFADGKEKCLSNFGHWHSNKKIFLYVQANFSFATRHNAKVHAKVRLLLCLLCYLQIEALQAGARKEIKVLLIFPKWEHPDDIYRIFTRDPVQRDVLSLQVSAS